MKEIKQIKGLFTNADQSDIADEFVTELENFKPLHGKITKTFGVGDFFGLDVLDIISTGNWVDTGNVWDDGQYWLDAGGATLDKALDESIINLVTFFNPNAEAGSGYGSGDGYVLIALAISSTTGVVTFYYWNGIDWENVTGLIKNTSSVETFYHIYGKNPVIQENGIIRFLPGGEKYAGSGSAIHQPNAAWLGWIEREFFDGLYSADDSDYVPGLYMYEAHPERPDISSSGLNATVTVEAGGTWQATDASRFYKIAYKYDGINLSLLSEEIKVTFTNDTYLKIVMTIDTLTFIKRITSIEVYRSETGNIEDVIDEIDGSYELIHSIDLIRDLDNIDVISGESGLCGIRKIYIPDIASATEHGYPTPNFNDWQIIIDGDTYGINAPTDPYSLTQTIYTALSDMSDDYWGVSWEIYVRTGGGYQKVWSGTAAYAGEQLMIMDEENSYATGVLAGSLLIVKDTTYITKVVDTNHLRAIKVATAFSSNFGTEDWQLLTMANGLYYFEEDGTDINIYFFDTKITEGTAYPLLNSPSIKVNAEQALYHLNRLWQFGRLVLDPGGENKEHDDWLTYSEINQPDVNPVSNVKRIADLTGGEGTGIATTFGSVLLLKQNSIHKMLIDDITDPTTWKLLDSTFKRGCIAKKGYIQIGHVVYFCASDGIYKLDVNFQAAVDETPLIHNRISEPINNIYLALNNISQKPYITCGYDKIETEIIFRLTSSQIYAYNITTDTWRTIDSTKTFDIFAEDQNGNLIIFNESDDKLYSIAESEAVGCKIVTKVWDIAKDNGNRKAIVRHVVIKYKSATQLTVKLYCDDDSTAKVTKTLAVSSVIIEKRLTVRYYCKTFKVEISDSATSTTDTEIYNIQID